MPKLDQSSITDTVYKYSIFGEAVMGSKGEEYQIIYRGQSLGRYFPGQWAFFQRPKECGGGYWLGRIYDDCFWLELEWPVSLHDGLVYMIRLKKVMENAGDFDDDFTLKP